MPTETEKLRLAIYGLSLSISKLRALESSPSDLVEESRATLKKAKAILVLKRNQAMEGMLEELAAAQAACDEYLVVHYT